VRGVTSRGDDEFEDIVQTSLASILVAVRSRPFQGEPSAPWVLRVARNVAIDRMRARSRERRMFFRGDGAPADASSSSALDPDHLTHVRDELRRFDVGLQRIGSARSAVVYLHDVLGHGLAHIADALSISVTAAQSRLIRGRRALRRQLLS
jgi:DNA-directed RNA polymerase specialized sigma24 family protein